MRFGAGIWLFGQFVDRYATDAYGPPVSTLEAIERAGAGRRHRGARHQLSVLRPGHHGRRGPPGARRGRASARGASRRTSTCASSRGGAFTNPDPAVRRRALELCEEGVDVAARLGAPTVKLWPGQDGFDYPFQADYRELWRLELDGVRTVAEMDPDVRVAIEYKTKEPRTHISLATAARTLLGIEQLGRDDVGIVVDLGHSLFAKETPGRRALARARARPALHDRGQRQLARVGRRHGRRLGAPDRDARVLPRGAQDRLGRADPARPVPVPRGPGRGRAHEHPDDARDRRARSTASTSTRCARRRSARTRSARSGWCSTCCSAASRSESRRDETAAGSEAGERPQTRRGVSPRIIGIAVLALVVAAMALDTTYKKPGETTATGRAAFDPASYGDEDLPEGGQHARAVGRAARRSCMPRCARIRTRPASSTASARAPARTASRRAARASPARPRAA